MKKIITILSMALFAGQAFGQSPTLNVCCGDIKKPVHKSAPVKPKATGCQCHWSEKDGKYVYDQLAEHGRQIANLNDWRRDMNGWKDGVDIWRDSVNEDRDHLKRSVVMLDARTTEMRVDVDRLIDHQHKPFYRTGGFWGGVAAVAIGSGYLILRNNMHHGHDDDHKGGSNGNNNNNNNNNPNSTLPPNDHGQYGSAAPAPGFPFP
jgi:hypothetical protein